MPIGPSLPERSRRGAADRLRYALALGIGLACFGAVVAPAQAERNGWARVSKPAPGAARVHGFYSKGCLAGARALPVNGRGFAVLRPQRNRFWGHPNMVAFVRDLARRVARAGTVLLIADLGQPRGGPVSGHASHQLGLDADIRLLMLPRSAMTRAYRADPPYVSMLTPDRKAIDRRRWSRRQIRLIRAAARDARVDRIFVHPVIKRALCRAVRKERRWLAKVVPWYGHHAHMHVRLSCPKGSPGCVRQRALPPGTGCGAALAWWFRKVPSKPAKRPLKKPRKPPLPRACAAVLAR
ncbi:MAG: penicillin-insensitive murein endopeptidase [Alphaproteobacteria bacterium]|nr:penicillin-insensitive murein endopeptidase [Alphaproteobacteria bacterium]